MTPSQSRPVFLLAALGGLTPSVGFADPVPANELARPVVDDHGSLPVPVMVEVCAVALVGLIALLIMGRIGWKLATVTLVGGCLLFGGDAIADGFQTAVAVSP